jgi:AcrR family transcriptional regulator
MSLPDRRALILDAAARVFATHGYDRASMREVAREAGITTPVLYDHFASKADLYATLVDAHADALISQWSDSVQATTAEGMFRESIEAIFSWIQQNEAGWRMLFLDSPSDQEVADALRRKQDLATETLAGLFHRLPRLSLSARLDRDRADQLLANAGKWAVNAIATWWWHNRDVTREQVVLLTTDLLWRGLGQIAETAEQPKQKPNSE